MYSKKSEYYDLPIKYNKTIIRLLLQSPKCMYAYWEISENTKEEFSNYIDDYNRQILKITNLTKNYSYEIPIDPFTNNYYIHVEDTDCKYVVELGRVSKNIFNNIYTSNAITIPSPTPHDICEDIIFKNYICLYVSHKIKVYAPKRGIGLRQDYYNLEFNPDDTISSGEQYRN